MSGRRLSLFLLLLAVSVLAAAPARAEMPEPGERDRQWELARASWDVAGDRQVVRLVGRNGRATVEALVGSRVTNPAWERAAGIGQEEYMALVARLLDARAWLEEWPRQDMDPNDPGPRRVVILRLIVGEEEHVRHALRGAPYDTLRGLVDTLTEVARTAQAGP